MEVDYEGQYKFSPLYTVPGSIQGCSAIQSLLLSTLECFYNSSDCFPILLNYIQSTYIFNVEEPSWFDPKPLHDARTMNEFAPNTLLSEIVKRVMIQEWNPSFPYGRFYTACAPSHCSYTQTARVNTFFEALIRLISTIGGLTISLRLITPHLVRFCIRLLSKKNVSHHREQSGT